VKYRLPGRWPVYSIGIFTGPSPLLLEAPRGVSSPVLTREDVTDHCSTFVADPFMIRVDGVWNMFFETLNWVGRRKGEIALATSRNGLRWTYRSVVLAEPFHLSHPYVLECGSDHHVIPESSAAGAVRPRRADPSPDRWVFVRDLITGPVHFDSSVFHRDGRSSTGSTTRARSSSSWRSAARGRSGGSPSTLRDSRSM
jgi:hypothetical protein